MSKRKAKKLQLDNNNLVLKAIQPLTTNQGVFFNNYTSDKSQVLLGYPGVGKTFLALHRALEEVNKNTNDYRRVIIVRSAVPTRDIGFLPGTMAEKTEVYELPYTSICSELFGRSDAYEILKKHRTVEFITTTAIRGITLDNAIVIVDEFQNMTAHEACSIITRIGIDSKILFCGDILQRDLTSHNEKDVGKFISVLEDMTDDFDFTHFDADDICRSDLVGAYIKKKMSKFPRGY
jgi:phosphate starvation-inducible PhoH-like protein